MLDASVVNGAGKRVLSTFVNGAKAKLALQLTLVAVPSAVEGAAAKVQDVKQWLARLQSRAGGLGGEEEAG